VVAFADSIEYARRLLPAAEPWSRCSTDALEPDVRGLLARLQPNGTWFRSDRATAGFSRIVLVEVAPESQFDALQHLASSDRLPTGDTLCLAGSGRSFHGRRNRTWTAVPGNLHVSMVLAPGRSVSHHGAACLALPAVATARAIETVVSTVNTVGVKWVNDLVIEDAKVAGSIAHTRAMGDCVEHVVLGIGLNVEATPQLERSSFVPRAGSLREHDHKVTQAEVLHSLLDCLAVEYQALLRKGPGPLLAAYRQRSIVIGRQVEVHPDSSSAGEPIVGRVVAISDDLELILDGRSVPVSRGRLRFYPPAT
jgi:biotin-[acetyl-CoA-carboxylase] ligase BirA-like protein